MRPRVSRSAVRKPSRRADPNWGSLGGNRAASEVHTQGCMDSDLGAFSRNPTDGSFAVLAFQLAAFAEYLKDVFLSYWLARIGYSLQGGAAGGGCSGWG